MELLKSFISVMAYASLGFSLASAYLKVNKLWKRKHHAEVSSSVSTVGYAIDVIPLSFFALNYMFAAQWQGFIDSMIWIIAALLIIMIGSGAWVQENRGKGFWRGVREAVKLERSEVTHLATTFFRPSAAEIILDILVRFALIDRDLADEERELIQAFADNWHLSMDWEACEELATLEEPASLLRTRETVEDYLKTSPPMEQVAQLIDVLEALTKADDKVSAQEDLIMEEVGSLLQSHISGLGEDALFQVIIAPQNKAQDTAITTLKPDAERVLIAGGFGYLAGSYYSLNFAQVMRDQYRALGFFTVDLDTRSSALTPKNRAS